jgi:hypothetical protein
MMPNGNYQPQTAFEGYVVAKLEGMSARLDALPCKDNITKVDKNMTDIANIKGKAGIIGAVLGAITGFLAALLSKLWVK